jgi:hypothetical protein
LDFISLIIYLFFSLMDVVWAITDWNCDTIFCKKKGCSDIELLLTGTMTLYLEKEGCSNIDWAITSVKHDDIIHYPQAFAMMYCARRN